MAISIVCLMVSCTNDDTQAEPVNPCPGQEVVFGTSLDVTGTRTNYEGPVSSATVSIKINWADGDAIKVYGTTCTTVPQAVYNVIPAKDASSNNTNYAERLDKADAVGVQWGSEATSDFYAVYPSTSESFEAILSEEDKSIVAAAINTTIRTNQHNVFEKVIDADNTVRWVGTPYIDNRASTTMPDALMYAYTPGAQAGKTVDLRFKPIATVLNFQLAGWTSTLELSEPTVYVQRIVVTAPSEIAGDFTLGIMPNNEEGTVSTAVELVGNNDKEIVIEPVLELGTLLTLEKGQRCEFNVFTIPQDDMVLNSDWTVRLETSHGNFTYTVTPTAADGYYPLTPGAIHKVRVPLLTVESDYQFDPATWMTTIPRNVYLSELSIPGSWYSVHPDYQTTTDLTAQYKAGIRAFNLDCRLSYDDCNFTGTTGRGNLRLVCAGTDKVVTGFGVSITPGDLVLDKLKTIAGLIPDDEYVVVVLTVAEKPLSRRLLSENYIYGNVDPAQVIPAITTMLNENAEALKLYTSEITANTTVGDVLGKMIVKINTNNASLSSYTYPDYALVSFASMAMSDYNAGDDNITDLAVDYYTKMQTADMFWANNAAKEGASASLTYYYHQAQRTTTDGTTVSGVPTLAQRKAAIDNIIGESKKIYDAGTHNGWFQLGVGGYIKDASNNDPDQSTVATELNGYVKTAIQNKIKTDPSPVGIVLMNQANSEAGLAVVNEILTMNGKFKLNRDPNKPMWPGAGEEEEMP